MRNFRGEQLKTFTANNKNKTFSTSNILEKVFNDIRN